MIAQNRAPMSHCIPYAFRSFVTRDEMVKAIDCVMSIRAANGVEFRMTSVRSLQKKRHSGRQRHSKSLFKFNNVFS